ncbi:MAG: HAMP domain-containing protein [Actinobacteria bacterium]|uniref:histidine kinase n=1 Tax=freshwater metagenome TaxID=449393 RepID=A0A6J6L532_9ZZZZ|nr:HAMP domain-containing protein [Actinomycetota bacterium]MSX24713.1 HAMP domain-containing protein [Actinomycetota bacterium]MSY45895.1 HAMP domain-containing protein [Actinomycetota bacterium]MTB00554.1 HAMP domain-containing protein [Actinomycetota bacterium]
MESPLRKVSNPLSMWSLRNRLIVGVVLLSAIGFAAADIAAGSALKSFLINQVDEQLLSVAGGTTLRLDQAGIAPDEATVPTAETETSTSEESENEATPSTARSQAAPKAQSNARVNPLRQVPTSMSVTLLDPLGNVVGVVGGDLNSQEIGSYITGLTPAAVLAYNGRPFNLAVPGPDFRVLARVLPSALGSVVVAQSLDNVSKIVHQLQLLFIFIGLIALLLIGLASRKVINISLKPLVAVEETAESIAGGDLSARLPEAKPDTEVGRLVGSLNQMLSRIEESFAARAASEERLRRFVADASHELRTPITAIRGFAELHRQGAVQGTEGTTQLLGRIEKESVRMGSLVEDLLLLARLDQSRDIENKPVNLNATITDAVESARAAGPNHPITISLPDEELYILGDNNRIHQVIANLLANARAHTPEGTAITVTASQSDAGTTVTVADKGPGLSQEDQERIFERFFRADPSRARTSDEGSGLGLSIVDAVMRAHNGRVSVVSKLGEGASFTLFFPASVNS